MSAHRTKHPKQAILFVRCSDALQEQLIAAAKENLRSLTSEVIYRLQESMKQTGHDRPDPP